MDTEPFAETAAENTTTTTAAAPPAADDDDDNDEEEARSGGARTTSAPQFWIDFSILDDGLDSAAADSSDIPPRFHRFPDLPPEIRLKVWSCLVAPRVVAACCLERDDRLPARRAAFAARSVPPPCKPSSSSSSSSSSSEPVMVFNPTCPVILLVCRESRALGLAHYELAFSWLVPLSFTPGDRGGGGSADPYPHPSAAAAAARPPRAWFNFRLDALYLAGALDPRDRYGFDTPVVRFLQPRDARRVRRLACAFSALRYPERGPDPAFGCLWHVVDRFPRARRLVLAVAPRDEEAMRPCPDDDHDHDDGDGSDDANVVRRVWDGWVRGTTVTTARVADTQVLLVREADLADVMVSHAREDEDEGERRVARRVA
ncbi:hypothetical protein LZ31DRAFT_510168, partial [Colletotrichum somersetense]